jgi:hypothetical protein
MAEKHNCEMFLVRYVPDVERGEFVNIGVVLIEANGSGESSFADVRFTRDWKKVSCFAPELERADVEILEEAVRANLQASAAAVWIHERQVNERELLLRGFEEHWSGSLQVAPVKGVRTALSPLAELDLLEQRYLVPLGRVRKEVGGRQAIFREIQRQFEKQGVWDLMLKKIPVAKYGASGDPLKIDCGYRPNGVVKMFHAVSMNTEPELAKSLAFSFPKLRAGIMEQEKADAELTAVVENELPGDSAITEFAMTVLLSNDIQVRKLGEMPRVAEQARVELKA